MPRTVHFRCGHAYHVDCVVANDPRFCVACFVDRSDIYSYCINSLNPLYPKVKKMADLVAKFEEKKFEVCETFKI